LYSKLAAAQQLQNDALEKVFIFAHKSAAPNCARNAPTKTTPRRSRKAGLTRGASLSAMMQTLDVDHAQILTVQYKLSHEDTALCKG
jgi:hypothetical protein